MSILVSVTLPNEPSKCFGIVTCRQKLVERHSILNKLLERLPQCGGQFSPGDFGCIFRRTSLADSIVKLIPTLSAGVGQVKRFVFSHFLKSIGRLCHAHSYYRPHALQSQVPKAIDVA